VNFAAILLVRVDQLLLWTAVGAVGGLILSYRGFRILQRKRLILNTPASRIRSAALGLIEVSGSAVGPYSIKAPLTGNSCYYYRTIAWELRKSGKNDEWRKVADESLHVPFYLDDSTGLLLVNPQGAEMDLHRDFREEYGHSFFSTQDTPDAVRGFLLRYGVGGEHKVRLEEYCIQPNTALFILGTLAENTGLQVIPTPVKSQTAKLAALHLQLGPTRENVCVAIEPTPGSLLPTLTVNTETEQEVINLSGSRPALSATEMTQQGKIAAALLKAGISNPAAWSAAGIQDPATALAMASGQQIMSATTAGAGASPAPAPEKFDLHPKIVLMKGENNPEFLISWRSQREVVSLLGWKAIAYIWGGPALTLVSVYLLLARLQWL
jgi:hypothetical protein